MSSPSNLYLSDINQDGTVARPNAASRYSKEAGSCLKRIGRIRNATLYGIGIMPEGRVSSSFVLGAIYTKESRTAMKILILEIAAL